MQAAPPVDAHVAADAQGDQRVLMVVLAPVMNHQPGFHPAALAAKAVAPDHALAQAAEKAQGMLAPGITGAAAAQPFQLHRLAAGAQQRKLARPSPLFEQLQAFH